MVLQQHTAPIHRHIGLSIFGLSILLLAAFLVHKPLSASAACSAQDTSRGTVTSSFTVATAGTYRVWSRIKAPDTTNNSYILEIDGAALCGVVVGDNGTDIPANTWKWVDYQSATTTNKINVTLSAGPHTMVMIGREDNVEVDRVILTTDTTCVPQDLPAGAPTSFGDNCANPADTTNPTVSLTAPANGAIVSGKTVAVTATAADDVAIQKVEFYVDGGLKSTDTSTSYSYTLDSTTLPNGNHPIYAIAYDTSGNHTQSATNTVTVSNAPTCTAGSSTAVTAPTAVTKSGSTVTSISLSWTASTPSPGCTLSGYHVFRDGVQVSGNITSGTTYTDTGLPSDVSHTYSVDAYDSGPNTSAKSATSTFSPTQDTVAPNIPAGLAATAPAPASVNLTWTAATDLPSPGGSGMASYVISRTTGTGATNPTSFIVTFPATTYTDTTVAASTKYNYSIASVDADSNQSAPSTIVSVTTPAPTCSGTPSTPTGLTAGAVTMTSITFTWTASTPSAGCTLSGYHVYRGGVLVGDSTGTGTTFTSTGLTPNITYSFTVVAFDTSAHQSSASTAKAIASAPDTSAPTAPTNVSATSTVSSQVSLAWTASTDNVAVTGYNIYRNGATSPTYVVGTVTSYTDTNVVANTTYTYQINAVDAAANPSAKAPTTAVSVKTPTSTDTTPPTTPGTPTTPVISGQGTQVTWPASTDNVGVVGYHVYIKYGTTEVPLGDSSGTTFTYGDLTGTGTVSSCFEPGVPYTLSIRAYDAAGLTSTTPATAQFTTTNTGMFPGDVNCNRVVDYGDLLKETINWQKTNQLPNQGDVDGNGIVNYIDLLRTTVNWGQGW